MLSMYPSSIRGRLIALIITAIFVGQGINLGHGLWAGAGRYTQSRAQAALSTAAVLSAAVAQDVSEVNEDGIYTTLRSVGQIPDVLLVSVTNTAGRDLVTLGASEQLDRDVTLTPGADIPSVLSILRSGTLEVATPIIMGGDVIGRIRLVIDTSDLPWIMLQTSLGSLISGAVALLVSAGLALRLQSNITKPLRSLSAAMDQMRRHKVYAGVGRTNSTGEVGSLLDGYNAMIAEIRNRDDRLASHLAHLEIEVAVRTDDYRKAAAEAAAANRAKSSFLAVMSHEIRTPLNGILVMAETLAAARLPDNLRGQVDIIARSGRSLLHVINEILDFSKIEAGRLEVDLSPVELAPILDDVVTLFGASARSKGLDLAVRCAAAQTTAVRANPERLRQVLSNLVNNAIKFTKAGGVLVSASIDAQGVRVSVADTGIGIPVDKLQIIFDAFSQADTSTSREYGGTGLGLAIAARLVDAMGGQLSVTSAVGGGSEFSFVLPEAASDSVWKVPSLKPLGGRYPRGLIAVQGEQTASALRDALELSGIIVQTDFPEGVVVIIRDVASLHALPHRCGPTGTTIVAVVAPGDDAGALLATGRADTVLTWPVTARGVAELLGSLSGTSVQWREDAVTDRPEMTGRRPRLLKVLVVDDSEVNREVARTALGSLGISPQIVADGYAAIVAAAGQDFDLILMDGSMPGLSGFEAASRIRLMEREAGRERTPIVALTAHVIGEAADAWREAGMDAVLHKPYTLAQLSQCVERHARRTGANLQPVEEDEAPHDRAASDLLDPGILDDLRQMEAGGDDAVTRIVSLYKANTTSGLRALADGVQRGNLADVAAAAHLLKSMSGNVGAHKVTALAATIESNARLQDDMPTAIDIDALEQCIRATFKELEQNQRLHQSPLHQSQK